MSFGAPPQAQPGRLQHVMHSAVRYARARLELLELEISAEREHLGLLMTRGLLLSLAALMTTQFAAILLLAAFWETRWRLHAVAALIVVALGATFAAWAALRRVQNRSSRPIAAALRELDELVEPPSAEGER
ncbi:MAG: phage holin family protein [Gammaproteobacteria bacterium]